LGQIYELSLGEGRLGVAQPVGIQKFLELISRLVVCLVDDDLELAAVGDLLVFVLSLEDELEGQKFLIGDHL
jgi:hypothetical protein